jgi:hypothetical protein
VIDHLVYATPDLDATVEDLAGRLGVRATPGGRHPGWGTRNALVGLGGGAYLEIIGIDREADGEAVHGPIPFGVDRLAGPRLAAWAALVDRIDDCVARAQAAGYDPGAVRSMSRRRPDGTELRWRLTAPGADPPEVVPFLIEWAPDVAHPSATSVQGCRLVSFAAEHPDPPTVATRLRAVGVDLPVTPSRTAALVAVIDSPAGLVELR